MVPSAISALDLGDRQLLDQLAVLVEHAGNVGEEEEARRAERAGDGAGEGVGVDVVGLAVGAGRHRRDHRDQFGAEQHVDDRAVDRLRLADEAEIDHLLDIGIGIDLGARHLLGDDHVAVLAGQADRLAALGVDRHDDLLVDRAGQHHLDDVDGALVGDPQPGAELGLDVELLQHLADLRAAAMDDDRPRRRTSRSW